MANQCIVYYCKWHRWPLRWVQSSHPDTLSLSYRVCMTEKCILGYLTMPANGVYIQEGQPLQLLWDSWEEGGPISIIIGYVDRHRIPHLHNQSKQEEDPFLQGMGRRDKLCPVPAWRAVIVWSCNNGEGGSAILFFPMPPTLCTSKGYTGNW